MGLGLGAVNCGTVTRTCIEELSRRSELLSRSARTGPFRHRLPVSGDENVLALLVREGHLSHGT